MDKKKQKLIKLLQDLTETQLIYTGGGPEPQVIAFKEQITKINSEDKILSKIVDKILKFH